MLKQTVHYEDFDGNASIETLYFNLSKSEVMSNPKIEAQFKDLETRFKDLNPNEEMTPENIQVILDLVKEVARLSYGIKSADGKRFQKTEELWIEFTQTAVYDAFLFTLFTDELKAFDFLFGVMPQDVVGSYRAEALALIKGESTPVETVSTPVLGVVQETPVLDEVAQLKARLAELEKTD